MNRAVFAENRTLRARGLLMPPTDTWTDRALWINGCEA